MAGFSSISSPDESAIDQILAEAMDHCVLEQVAAINCSSFSHSVLPSHLENRFHKLKTFPSSSSKPKLARDSWSNSAGHSLKENSPSGHSKDSSFEKNLGGGEGEMGNSLTGQSKVSTFEGSSGNKKAKKGNSPPGYVSSPSDSSSSGDGEGRKVNSSRGHSKVRRVSGDGVGKTVNSPRGHSKVSSFNGSSGHGRGKKGISQSGSVSFEGDTSDSEVETAKKGGCLWCSPKRVSKKTKKGSSGRNVGGVLGFDFEENDEILSDLRSFSSKEQKRRLKEVKREEEKINKEAEKIVKWAKQVSARLEFSLSDEEFSDGDDDHDHGQHFGLH